MLVVMDGVDLSTPHCVGSIAATGCEYQIVQLDLVLLHLAYLVARAVCDKQAGAVAGKAVWICERGGSPGAIFRTNRARAGQRDDRSRGH